MVIFAIAILGIFVAVFGYITLSHSLDVTASNIDSQVGQLDGYLTITFEGDNIPRVKNNNDDSILKRATDFFIGENDETQTVEPETDSNIKTEKANLDNVRDFYRDKDSTVCAIKCSDYDAYLQGEVFERGYWKIGVLSITPEILNEAVKSNVPTINIKHVQENIYKLRYENEVDLVVVICPDQKISKYIDKIDCLICKTVTTDVPDNGKVIDDVFIMRDPNAGSIGTILSSPAKMLSGRVYTKVEIVDDYD